MGVHEIVSFFGSAPKSYQISYEDKTNAENITLKKCVKVKGFSLRGAAAADALEECSLEECVEMQARGEEITLPLRQFFISINKRKK
ncbi:MAG TPA: hypothetical protein VIY47_03060, partial [Ignavibacteriaceae bacterium]